MKTQQKTKSTANRAHLLTPRGRSRIRFALVALACALFGVACVTTTLVTEVVQKGPGETYIGQSMSIEFDKGVWDALDPSDRSQIGGTFDSMKAQGWNVSIQDGGRIQTASLAPLSLADLQAKGWKVSVTATDKGKITTVKWG